MAPLKRSGETAMRVVASLALMMLLSACAAAPVPWQNPSLPKDQWSRDWSACKRWADSQVGYQDDDSSSSPFRDYDRGRARKEMDAYAGSCMRDRGYTPTRRPSP
jgi:hypothetical protein